VLGLGLFVGIVVLAWGELRALDWIQIQDELVRTNPGLLLLAGLAVFANVAAMGLYDAVCFPKAPRLGFFTRWGLGSLCFAWSNFLTLGPIGGPAMRMLVYSRRGMKTPAIARGLGVQYIGFCAGLFAWTVALALPLPRGPGMLVLDILSAAGISVLSACLVRAACIRLLRKRDPGSETARALEQTRGVPLGLVGFLDWGFSLTCFWLVAAAAGLMLDPFFTARTFFSGHLAGMASMLPGGLGSADAVWLLSFTEADYEPDKAAAVIVLFRLIFYIAPWAIALLVTLRLVSGGTIDRAWRPRFVVGGVLVGAGFILISGAIPTVHERILMQSRGFPPLASESLRLVALLSAAGLFVLAPALLAHSRRALETALLLLTLCTLAHLIKGADPQEATACALALLLLTRRDFDRATPATPTPARTAASALVPLLGFAAIGFAAVGGTRIHPSRLTDLAPTASAPRFFRAVIGLGALTILWTAWSSVLAARSKGEAGPGTGKSGKPNHP
jgi:phosphatidylglycerol lysyltransferase